MVEENRDCIDILRQLTSISGAINGVWINVAGEHLKNGITELPLLNYDETITEILEHLRSLK